MSRYEELMYVLWDCYAILTANLLSFHVICGLPRKKSFSKL